MDVYVVCVWVGWYGSYDFVIDGIVVGVELVLEEYDVMNN